MSEYVLAIIQFCIPTLIAGGGFVITSVVGTKFVNASRELIRDSIIKDYMEYYEKKEIPRLRRESIDRKYAGLVDMKPSVSDPTMEDMFNEIRKWKIID